MSLRARLDALLEKSRVVVLGFFLPKQRTYVEHVLRGPDGSVAIRMRIHVDGSVQFFSSGSLNMEFEQIVTLNGSQIQLNHPKGKGSALSESPVKSLPIITRAPSRSPKCKGCCKCQLLPALETPKSPTPSNPHTTD